LFRENLLLPPLVVPLFSTPAAFLRACGYTTLWFFGCAAGLPKSTPPRSKLSPPPSAAPRADACSAQPRAAAAPRLSPPPPRAFALFYSASPSGSSTLTCSPTCLLPYLLPKLWASPVCTRRHRLAQGRPCALRIAHSGRRSLIGSPTSAALPCLWTESSLLPPPPPRAPFALLPRPALQGAVPPSPQPMVGLFPAAATTADASARSPWPRPLSPHCHLHALQSLFILFLAHRHPKTRRPAKGFSSAGTTLLTFISVFKLCMLLPLPWPYLSLRPSSAILAPPHKSFLLNRALT
jgi:hypothetical protein